MEGSLADASNVSRNSGSAINANSFLHLPCVHGCRRVAGKNLRRRSSIIINDDLLVDIGPDIATASFEHNLSLANISVCLQTHAHEDHLDTEFIISRHTEYGTVSPVIYFLSAPVKP